MKRSIFWIITIALTILSVIALRRPLPIRHRYDESDFLHELKLSLIVEYTHENALLQFPKNTQCTSGYISKIDSFSQNHHFDLTNKMDGNCMFTYSMTWGKIIIIYTGPKELYEKGVAIYLERKPSLKRSF